jgi:hypothetical protein
MRKFEAEIKISIKLTQSLDSSIAYYFDVETLFIFLEGEPIFKDAKVRTA